MCDSGEVTTVWTLRDRRTGRTITSREGYTYAFSEESAAQALAARLNDGDVELVQVREPGV
jgi:hypothetical protein